MSDYLDRLSDFVSETGFEDLSPDAIAAVKDVTLDTLGAIVAGSREPENRSLARLAAERSGTPAATILGHELKAEPMLATLVNATAGVALEMDEGNRFGGGHPAIHSLPGALAVGEEMGASGRRFIESVLVGYEIESRVGSATRPRSNVHSHGHWGHCGHRRVRCQAPRLQRGAGPGGDQPRGVDESRQLVDTGLPRSDDPQPLPRALGASRGPGGSPVRVWVHRSGRRSVRRVRHDHRRPLRPRGRGRRPGRRVPDTAELLQVLRLLPSEPRAAAGGATASRAGAVLVQ